MGMIPNSRAAIPTLVSAAALSLAAALMAADEPKTAAPGTAPAAAAGDDADRAAKKREELKAAADAKKAEAAKQKQETQQFNAWLEDAVKQLVAEARELDDTKTPKVAPVFTRPHPALKGMTGDAASEILSRMARPFTGNEYRDSYVRWHLAYIVKQAGEGELRRSGAKVIQLINQMPEAIQVEIKPWWRDEPEDVSREYHRLLAMTRTEVGYPPFERVYWGREALAHMTAARKQEMTPIVSQLEALRGKWKRITVPELLAFNERVRKVNWVVRQYRGELIYTLLLTGDPSMLDRVVSEVGRQVKRKDRAGIDITAFIYLAALDGVLNRYPQTDLQKAGKSLEAVARAAEGYVAYTNGKFQPPPWAPRKEFNFADYAFHLVHMLDEGPSLYLGSQAVEISEQTVSEAAVYTETGRKAAPTATKSAPAKSAPATPAPTKTAPPKTAPAKTPATPAAPATTPTTPAKGSAK